MKLSIKSMIENIRKQKNNHAEQEEKRIPQNEDGISSFWDNFKRFCIIGVPEGEEKEQEIGTLFEKIENFPNLVKEIDVQVQGAQRVPNKMDAKRPTARHIN